MQDSFDSDAKDVSVSGSTKLKFQQKENTISENYLGNQHKDNKTIFDTSDHMDLTFNPQNLTIMQDSFDNDAKDVSVFGSTKLKFQQKEDTISKENKTVLNISKYMDLTCKSQNLVVMQDSFDNRAKNVSISRSTKLKFQKKEDTISKNYLGNQHKDNKTIFDTSDHMDLTCNLQNVANMQNLLDDNGKNASVSEPPLIVSEQNKNVTLKDCYKNESDKTKFDSCYMDLTSNLKGIKKVMSEVPESSMENVSESLQLTTQQNDVIIDKCKTVFDTCYMDLTCNPQDLSSVEPNSLETSIKDISVLKSIKQTVDQSDEISINKDKNLLNSSQIGLTCQQGSRTVSVGVPNDIKDIFASQSKRYTTERCDDDLFLVKQKMGVEVINNIDENKSIAVGMLHHSKMQIPCVEKKLSEDDAHSVAVVMKSTSVSLEREHSIYSSYSDKENIKLHGNANIPNQIQNKNNLSVLNDLDDQELRKKFGLPNCMGVTENVKDLKKNLSESLKERINLTSSSDSTQMSKENYENLHESFTVKQNENMRAQNCALEIVNSGICTKKKLKDTEMPQTSSYILKSQADNEILNTALLKNQNIQKVKDFIVITENPSEKHTSDADKISTDSISKNSFVSSENKNAERVLPNLLRNDIAEAKTSFPHIQNPQKLGDYMFVKTDVRQSKKGDAYKDETLDSYNPNLILHTGKSNSKLEKETDEVFISKVNLLKGQVDTKHNSDVLFVESSKKQEKNIESTREPPCCSKVENKTDEEKINLDKRHCSVPVEISSKILMNEAEEDNFPNCRENMAKDIKIEQDNKYSSDSDILYAIKQIKGMTQSVPNEQNVLKFPEVFLSVKKNTIPPKPPFSCSIIQLSKAIREYTRRKSGYSGGELSFLSDSKHNILPKSGHSLPKDSEKPLNSESCTLWDIPSTSQVLRSETKIVQNEPFTNYNLSPKQIQDAEDTHIPQMLEESCNLNKTLDDLDSLKKSLNFDNEVTSCLPKIVESSGAEENISNFRENKNMFSDNSEFYLENCSIDLVPNDDTLDSSSLKQNSKLDSNKLSIPSEIFSHLSDRKSVKNKEVFIQVLQNEVRKENVERSSVFLCNSVVELESRCVQESEKDLCFDNSSSKQNNSCQDTCNVLKKQSFDSEMLEDKNKKSNTTEETFDFEMQKVLKPLNASKFKTDKQNCESVYLINENQSLKEAQSNMNESQQEALKGKSNEEHCSSGMIHSQCLSESNQVLEIVEGKNSVLRKELESHITPDLSSNTLKRKGIDDNRPFNESNLLNIVENKIVKEVTNSTLDKCFESNGAAAISDSNQGLEITKEKNGTLSKEQESHIIPDCSASTLKINVNDEDNIPFNESNILSTEKNKIIKKVTNSTLSKNFESSDAAAISNTSVSSKTKIIDDQCKKDSSHKQDSSSVKTEITERSNNQGADSESQNHPSNLCEGNGKCSVLVNEGNMDITKKCKSKVTKDHKYQVSTKKVSQKRKKESKKIKAKKNCSPILDAVEICNKSFDNYCKKFQALKEKLEASSRDDCLWRLRKMDEKEAVFGILPLCPFACYLIHVPLELNAETSSRVISFEHLKPVTDAKDELGFLFFKTHATSEITFSPFSADELIKILTEFVALALRAKDFIKDLWFASLSGKITIDSSQEIPKLTVPVLNSNHFSFFALTFAIDLRSYPTEKLIPKIDHLNDDNILSSESILNVVQEIEPGVNYLSRMIKAINAL